MELQGEGNSSFVCNAGPYKVSTCTFKTTSLCLIMLRCDPVGKFADSSSLPGVLIFILYNYFVWF